MLDTDKLMKLIVVQMSKHLLKGKSQLAIIDDLEIIFTNQYREYLAND